MFLAGLEAVGRGFERRWPGFGTACVDEGRVGECLNDRVLVHAAEVVELAEPECAAGERAVAALLLEVAEFRGDGAVDVAGSCLAAGERQGWSLPPRLWLGLGR